MGRLVVLLGFITKIVEAYRFVETGQKIGNVLILIDPAI